MNTKNVCSACSNDVTNFHLFYNHMVTGLASSEVAPGCETTGCLLASSRSACRTLSIQSK